MSLLLTKLMLFLAYLLGSVSSAILICKLFHLPDPRTAGSHNPGASNVLRIAGKSKAATVLIFDVFKGMLPVLFGRYLFHADLFWQGMIGLFAVLGHVFSIFYHGKGGKGVATALGVYLGLNIWVGLLCAAAWGLTFKKYRYASLASLISICLGGILMVFFYPGTKAWVPVFLIAALVVFKHHSNISRLLKGTESKFNTI